MHSAIHSPTRCRSRFLDQLEIRIYAHHSSWASTLESLRSRSFGTAGSYSAWLGWNAAAAGIKDKWAELTAFILLFCDYHSLSRELGCKVGEKAVSHQITTREHKTTIQRCLILGKKAVSTIRDSWFLISKIHDSRVSVGSDSIHPNIQSPHESRVARHAQRSCHRKS